jgi:hypothetical protein
VTTSTPGPRSLILGALRLALICLGSVLTSACVGPLTPTAPAPSAAPTLSPTPGLVVRLGSWHFDQDQGRLLAFVGLASGPAASEVEFEVSLLDERGDELDSTTAPLLGRYLIPSSQGFLAAVFPPGLSASSVRVRVTSFRPAPAGILALEGTTLDADWLTAATAAVFGRLTNPQARRLSAERVLVVGLDKDKEPVAYALGQTGADSLAPDEEIPFRADVPEATDVDRWVILALGSPPNPSAPGRVELESVELRFDSQGKPFATGFVVNPSDQPRQTRLLLLATGGEDWLAAGTLTIPVPLRPRSRMAFHVDDFPGLTERRPLGDDASALAIVPFVADSESEAVLVDLVAEVTAFEVIGSRLYLHGELRVPDTVAVLNPTLFATVLSAEGELVSAGLALAAERAGPGQTVPFLLTIPIPAHTDLALAEYDVRAWGIRE